MKKVAIIGAGMMSPPIANYFLDICDYQVVMVDQVAAKARDIIGNRPKARAAAINIRDSRDLDPVIKDVDIVVSMVPRPVHIHAARSCLRHGKSMLTASYETPEIKALADEAREKGILILNEMGEDPGIDHLGTMLLLDEVREQGGEVIDVKSYGSGIPSFQHNNNPMGYKFSWDPRTFFVSAQTGAAYYIDGRRVEVPGDRLFEHFWLVDIEGLGTFETYPNKDCKKYLEVFGFSKGISYYRGLLRFPGYCNNMRYLNEIGLFDSKQVENFNNMTYRQFTAFLLGVGSGESLERDMAGFLKLDINADFIHRLEWLGFFDDRPMVVRRGTRQEVLLERMLEKMSYAPHEKDMVIVHIEVTAEFPGKRQETRLATMVVEGIPYGDSAMSRAVGFTIAIGTRMVLEGKIKAVGVHIPPTLPGIYKPVLEELAAFGFVFNKKFLQGVQGGSFFKKRPPGRA
ncbi:MAG: saccharopine dehydrogenase NADP-binding domain-containing protein [Candidatus Aminicenantes bacterium]|nr:MAG: saccharopine dehydrogenase NADP-binding domain-containing protein [Candidatus Aminicenantes bacterium]